MFWQTTKLQIFLFDIYTLHLIRCPFISVSPPKKLEAYIGFREYIFSTIFSRNVLVKCKDGSILVTVAIRCHENEYPCNTLPD